MTEKLIDDIYAVLKRKPDPERPNDKLSDIEALVRAAKFEYLSSPSRLSANDEGGVAKSLADMIIEYVEGGLRTNQNWKNGLAAVIEKRLQRLTTPKPEAHPDDLAVDLFAAAMKEKLAKKRAEGRGGWDRKDECSGAFLSQLIVEHIEKGDPLDVGNIAMMLHQRGERIADEQERLADREKRRDQKLGLGR